MHERNVAAKMLQVQVFGINIFMRFGAEVLEVADRICDNSVNFRTFFRKAFYFHGIYVSWNIILFLKTVRVYWKISFWKNIPSMKKSRLKNTNY